MQITLKDGSTREIIINKMGAMEGWDLQRRFIEFAMSQDRQFRTEYTMEILSFAQVQQGENKLPLSTPALIENHLGDWTNIKLVFESVLRDNGIDPDTHAEKDHYWANAGAELAAAFIEQSVKLIGPLMQKNSE